MASITTIIRECYNDPAWHKTNKLHWFPEKDMKSLTGKVVVITGPNSGIGYETLRQVVLSGAKAYLFGRNVEKMQTAIKTIQSESEKSLKENVKLGDKRYGGTVGEMVALQCDLSSLQSIKKVAQEFLSKEERLDIFFGNAGLFMDGTTKDGYELMFGTNALGHHALIRLLLPAIRKSAELTNSKVTGETRIVFTSSSSHRWLTQPSHLTTVGLDDVKNSKLKHLHLYGRSKIGNILTTNKLAALSKRNGDGIVSCSVHPGAIQSGLGSASPMAVKMKSIFLKPAWQGALTQLWGATAADKDEVNGKYLIPWARVGEENDLARNEQVRDDVWKWCEEQCLKHGLIDEVIA